MKTNGMKKNLFKTKKNIYETLTKVETFFKLNGYFNEAIGCYEIDTICSLFDDYNNLSRDLDNLISIL